MLGLTVLTALLVAVSVPPTLCCDHPVGYEPWNISRRVQAAELVVWGRVLATHGFRVAGSTSYTAEVQFECQVKGDAEALAEAGTFNVTDMGLVNPAHCVANHVDVGAYYFFFLTYNDAEVLTPQDVNQQSAVVPDCEENRQAFFRCCGFYTTFCRPEGGADVCPTTAAQPNPDKPTEGAVLQTTPPDISGATSLGTAAILLFVAVAFVVEFVPI